MDLRVKLPQISVFPRAEASLQTIAVHTDRAEAWTKRLRSRAEPLLETVYGLRRRMATAAVSLFAAWLFLHVMLGANGMVVYRTKRAEYENLQKEIGRTQNENAQYSEQIDELKTDPKRIEKEAREQFHYARPGEVVYVSPEPRSVDPPVTHSASK
jgi:cell division protein FtsB